MELALPIACQVRDAVSLRHLPAKVMTVKEIAKYFGIPRKRVYEMLRREADAGFPCFRVGRGWRVDLDQMREWMCQRIEEKNLDSLPYMPSKARNQ
jgi:excisionase family DNA binding protein